MKISPFTIKETGKVREIKEIIVTVEGLPSCLNGQLIELGRRTKGIVMSFSEAEALVLVLGDESKIRIGQPVSSKSEPFKIPVGKGFIGRIVNALGEPCDGGSVIETDTYFPVFNEPPGITDRAPVEEFLATGVKVVDALIPLGKGQRQLIIGDRMTGKTIIAVDTILNQKNEDTICIYCCIGKPYSALMKTATLLKQKGAWDYTIFSVALDNASTAEQYLLPFTAATMGEYFMQKGKNVLVVFDDITKHAWSYRQLSLLLERPPGREAYPGDIFYLHTQLMERAGRLNEAKGGGSMTFLTIVDTLQGDLTGYIPSNLISMSDGQICMSSSLFGEGFRPAVDIGLSVSIIGGRVQPVVLRELSSALRREYAQYRELLRLSRLRADLSEEAKTKLKRGEAIMSVLEQYRGEPVSLEEEIILFYALRKGVLDDLTAEEKIRFRQDIFAFAREVKPGILKGVAGKKEFTPEIKQGLDALLDEYFKGEKQKTS